MLVVAIFSKGHRHEFMKRIPLANMDSSIRHIDIQKTFFVHVIVVDVYKGILMYLTLFLQTHVHICRVQLPVIVRSLIRIVNVFLLRRLTRGRYNIIDTDLQRFLFTFFDYLSNGSKIVFNKVFNDTFMWNALCTDPFVNMTSYIYLTKTKNNGVMIR